MLAAATWRLQLHRPALDALVSAPQPVCLVAVAGPAGHGKTTLANALASAIAPGSGGTPFNAALVPARLGSGGMGDGIR